MRDHVRDSGQVACCGLFCGACGAFLRKRCPGCRQNKGASWCKVRSCCIERAHRSCADCTEIQSVRDCRKYHNWISRIVGWLLRSDRAACIARIRQVGYDEYSEEMARQGLQTIKRRS